MYSIELMVSEHDNIQRMLVVVRNLCVRLMEGAEVPDADLREIIEFIRKYADKHHHGKEEKFLFPVMVEKLGRVADNLVTHGMLVEHDLGRGHILALETALNEYQKTPTKFLKLDIMTEAMAYAHLLKKHIEKENSVVYTYAERSLDPADLAAVDEKSRSYEKEQSEAGIQDKYLEILSRMEAKYNTED